MGADADRAQRVYRKVLVLLLLGWMGKVTDGGTASGMRASRSGEAAEGPAQQFLVDTGAAGAGQGGAGVGGQLGPGAEVAVRGAAVGEGDVAGAQRGSYARRRCRSEEMRSLPSTRQGFVWYAPASGSGIGYLGQVPSKRVASRSREVG